MINSKKKKQQERTTIRKKITNGFLFFKIKTGIWKELENRKGSYQLKSLKCKNNEIQINEIQIRTSFARLKSNTNYKGEFAYNKPTVHCRPCECEVQLIQILNKQITIVKIGKNN